MSNDQLSGATKLMPAAPVAVPAGWEFKPGDGVITVMTPGGGACTLYASGGGGVESMAYRMATMLATAPQPPAQSDHLVDANNMTQAAKVVVPAEWKMVPVDALTRWRDAFAEELEAWDISPPLHHVKASHDEINALLAAASHPQDGSAAMLQVPDGLSRIDAEFWLRHRSDVIEACRKAGITIVTAERGVHLMSLGNIKAQAAPQSPAQADHLVDANKMTRADPVAKPLTREQIESMRRDGMEPDDYPEPWAYTRGVRDAERAHGIGRPAAGEWGAL